MSVGHWLRNHPRLLEMAYHIFSNVFRLVQPILKKFGFERVDYWLRSPERWVKELIFGCHMCGQCILRSTGMTCSMTCPKQLRNGACGGVRANGHCEVKPEMRCVWVEAYERSKQLKIYGVEIESVQRPVNWQLKGTSAWVNMLTGKNLEAPKAWSLPILKEDKPDSCIN